MSSTLDSASPSAEAYQKVGWKVSQLVECLPRADHFHVPVFVELQ